MKTSFELTAEFRDAQGNRVGHDEFVELRLADAIDGRARQHRVGDVRNDADGASFGRTLFTRPFDGSVLGPYLTQVRPPLSAFSVFGGMQIDMFEAGELTAALKRPSAFWYSAKKTLRYAKDRMVHGRGAFMANGNALVGRLLRSALTAKVELWRNAQATGLFNEGGAVVGAKIMRDGSEITVGARKGVVLVSGGFGVNADLRAKYIPFAKFHISL